MMRVLHLTHYGELYGANRSLLDLVLGLRPLGIGAAVVMAREGPLRERLEAEGVPCRVEPFAPWMERRLYMGGPHHRLAQWWRHRRSQALRGNANAAAVGSISRWAADQALDLVHAHSAVIGIGGEVARSLRLPLVQHVRELHQAHYGYRVDGGERRFVALLRAAAAVVVGSAAARNAVRTIAGKGLPVEVLPNGIATRTRLAELSATGDARWRDPLPFRFVLLGLFHSAKGQLEAVEALARLCAEGIDARLVLAGDGRVEPVRERIAALGLGDAVELPGLVADPWRVLAGAHALLNCSRHEAFGRTTWEAMACGLPVIGHASGATPELVDHDRNGLLYTTADELLDRMRTLATDPVLARRLGEEARRTLPSAASVEAMCEAMARLYCRVTGRPAPDPAP